VLKFIADYLLCLAATLYHVWEYFNSFPILQRHWV